MNLNNVLFPESHVYIHLTHCLHTPYILWMRRNRNQILNQSIGPQVAHRSVPCSKASVCLRRFLLTGRCALRSCSCPEEGLPSLHPGPLCPASCLQSCFRPERVASAKSPQSVSCLLPWQGNMGSGREESQQTSTQNR